MALVIPSCALCKNHGHVPDADAYWAGQAVLQILQLLVSWTCTSKHLAQDELAQVSPSRALRMNFGHVPDADAKWAGQAAVVSPALAPVLGCPSKLCTVSGSCHVAVADAYWAGQLVSPSCALCTSHSHVPDADAYWAGQAAVGACRAECQQRGARRPPSSG